MVTPRLQAVRLPTDAPLRGRVDAALLKRLRAHIALSGGDRDELPVAVPATGEVLGSIPRGLPDDVREAVRRARAARPAWEARGFRERGRIFLRFHDLLLARQEQGLDLMQLESGKARRYALEEVLDTAIVARYYALHARRLLRPRRRRGAFPLLTSTWELHHPVGVVGFVVPWNYPLNLAVTDAIPALMAGNTAVLKPDHQTSFTALWAVELLREAGLPADVLPVVTGFGPELGPALVESVDFVMFTGSTRTGRQIARQAGERLIGYSLELGGKNPMLVLADADLEKAVDGALRGCFVGAGQVCVSTERLFVHDSLYHRFVERFVERTRGLSLGFGLDYRHLVGSLSSERQLRTVTEHVEDAVSRGATVLAGGKPRPELGPFFYEPTVLAGVTPEMRVHAEETFGPVVSVYPFREEEEAIRRANDTRYGLSASVWTRDARRGREVARRIQAGSVNVNEAYAATWGSVDSPIGGFKESGHGRRHGAEGILKYTEAQTIAVQRLVPFAPPPRLGDERYARVMSGAIRLLRRLPGLR